MAYSLLKAPTGRSTFINAHVPLQGPVLPAPRMDEAALANAMTVWAVAKGLIADPSEAGDLDGFAAMLLQSPLVRIFPDIENEHENVTADIHERFGLDDGTPLLGFQRFPSGFSFLGCESGSDYGEPVFYCLYWTGKDVAAYVPARGNLVNMDAMSAFGSEPDSKADLRKLLDKYEKAGACRGSARIDPLLDVEAYQWMDMYLEMHKGPVPTLGTVPFKWDEIVKDIRGAIYVT